MQSSSSEFTQLITNLDNRKTLGAVEIQFVNPQAKYEMTCTTASCLSFCHGNDSSNTNTKYAEKTEYNYKLIDDIRNYPSKLAIMEQDLITLDGSFMLGTSANSNTYAQNYLFSSYVGTVLSDSNCNINGTFTDTETGLTNFTRSVEYITVKSKAIIDNTMPVVNDLKSICITFSPENNIYAVNFDIRFLYRNSSGNTSLVKTINVCDNQNYKYETIFDSITNFNIVLIDFYKLNRPNVRNRINEIDFGPVRLYKTNNGEYKEFNIIEELDITNNQMPSAEFNIKLINNNGDFDLQNTNGLSNLLFAGQPIKTYIGVNRSNNTEEYVCVGTFFSTEYKAENRQLFNITGRNIIDIIDKIEAPALTGTMRITTLLDQTCALIPNKYKIKIDRTGINLGTTNGFINTNIDKETVKSRLLKICQVAQVQMLVDYSNPSYFATIYFKKLNNTNVLNLTYNYSLNPPTAERLYLIKEVYLKYKDSNLVDQSTIYQNTTMPEYNQGKQLKIENNNLLYKANSLYDDIPLVNISNYILENFNKYNEYKVKWIGDPRIQLGDTVNLETQYARQSGDINLKNNYCICVKNEIKYNGILRYTSTFRGGVI